jgi:hypothetical protein
VPRGKPISNYVAPQFEVSNPRSAIQGVVKDAATAEPLAGVTITATSPSMLGVQTAITDEMGIYRIAVPPGEYLVTFYYLEITLERRNVHVAFDETTPVFQTISQR